MSKQMNVSLRELRTAAPVLQKLATADVPPRLAYLLARAIREISPELESIEVVRTKLVTQFGDEQPDGSWRVAESQAAEFQAAWDELLDTEAALEIVPIPIQHFPDSLRLTPAEMLTLLFLLE